MSARSRDALWSAAPTPRPECSAVGTRKPSLGLRKLQTAPMRRGAAGGAVAAFAVVAGPGVIAGLSDDDPAGITTYSILGADYGYQLLWIIPASTVLLVQFHLMAMRIGAASG